MSSSSNSSYSKPPQLKSLSLPFKTRLIISFLSLVSDHVRRADFTVNRRVFNFFDRRVPANPTPHHAVSTHDITVDADKNLSFRFFVPHHLATVNPPSSDRLPVIVFFHGGGFAFLSVASTIYDNVCRRFAGKFNAVVCSVEYRLAPEHKFPAPYDDGAAVLDYLDKHRHQIPSWPENADVSHTFIAGDSAGGNICHHVTVKACSDTSFSEMKVVGLINIQPFFGGKERMTSEVELEGAPVISAARTEWMWKAFLPDGVDNDHWAVNVSGPNAIDLKGFDFPETLLFVGGFDPLKDRHRRYCEWLRKCGIVVKLVEYSDAIHAFYLFPELPQEKLFFTEVKDFIHRKCQ